MTSLNPICQIMKLKLAKNDQKFCHFLELLGDRLEVCVSVNCDWVYNWACRLSRDVQVISNFL